MLGQVVLTQKFESPTDYIAVQTQYDSMGRVWKVSNPYRNGQSPVWTTTAYDMANRVISVTTPDNAAVTTSYASNTVTVSDQAGKQRKSVTDGAGRLIQVYEDPAALNYLTSYSYDILDNLTTVSQGTQTRSFVYDSLKRLRSATNPESGTITYQYDDNGNLTFKTDARGVTSTYVYDALNRNTSIDYSDATPDVVLAYDSAINGKGRLSQSLQSGTNTAATYIDEYDASGRPRVQRQRFETNGVWSNSYQVSRNYNLGGNVNSQTYPSGHTVNYTYDGAGRTLTFTGNLGDGTSRTYANGIGYSEFGGLRQEQFGTATPVHHKMHYNIRGQLYDVRASHSADEWGGELGALVNYYGSQWVHGGSGPDNNGNVMMSQTIINSFVVEDHYSYDSLNRLTALAEWQNGATNTGVQTYDYDRYGNRTINAAQTSGVGINTKQFTVNAANNRLGVPGGQSGTMTYDAAGNLTVDTHSALAVSRAYDAENRMTSETQSGGVVAGSYSYNADGQRVRRTVSGQPSAVETWQVYGMDGELLAEYEATSPVASPQKEYGYRNGQLLITAEPSAQLKWLVADHLGTPRMIVDQTGALANVKRHDYLPFGEELYAGQGGRTIALGYSSDATRQKFTSKERDIETGLDYFLARYYLSTQGRFTNPDEFKGGPHEVRVLGSGDSEKQALVYADVTNPQSLNKYQYCLNNPLRYVDPDGHNPQDSFDIRFQKLHQDRLDNKITEKQYWENLRGAAVGTAAGLAAVAIAIVGRQAGAAILIWAAQNPNSVQHIASVVQEAGGGPPGALTGAVSGASKAEMSIIRKLLGEGKNVQVLAPTGVGRTADIAINGIKAELKTLEGVNGVATSGTVKNAIGRALGQSGNVIINASNVKLSAAEAQKGAARAFSADSRLKVVRIYGKDFDYTITRQK